MAPRHRHTARGLALLVLAAAAPVRAEVEFTYGGPPVAIPDASPAGVNILLSVSGLNAITDLDVRLFGTSPCDATLNNPNAAVAHTFVGDLVVTLTSPVGTTALLVNRRGGTRENICFLTLDDDGGFPALSTITSITGSPMSGSFVPESPLSVFDGENPNGLWSLNISDNKVNDNGALRRFSLVLDTLPNVIDVDVLADPVPGTCVPGSCSLREAVSTANALPGPERIVLPASAAIALTRAGAGEDNNATGDIDITDDLEIVGAGALQTTLTQAAADRVFHVIGAGTRLVLRDLRIQGGNGVADGGAVYMPGNGRLVVADAILSGHRATEHGGAIYHAGGGSGPEIKIDLRGTTFDDNRATNATAANAYGGALYSISSGFQSDYMRVEDCTFHDNRSDNGGGALAFDGVLSVSGNGGTIRGSTFDENHVTAGGPGGAVATNVEDNGVFSPRILDSLFTANSTPATGATSLGGAVSVRNGVAPVIANSIFSQNSARAGGAFHGDVTEILDSTFCLNTATDSGGALNLEQFEATIRRSTLCANTVTTTDPAQTGGGAIAKLFGNLIVERSTLDGNVALRGAGIAFGGIDLLLFSNTIVAPSPLPAGALGSVLRYTNTDGTDDLFFLNNIMIGQCSYSAAGVNPDSARSNIEASGNTCRLLLAPLQAGNQTAVSGASINLGPLAVNGGPTNTRVPAVPSIAIDAGYTIVCTPLDQRGYQRTDASCDIGSVEAGGVPLPDVMLSDGFE